MPPQLLADNSASHLLQVHNPRGHGTTIDHTICQKLHAHKLLLDNSHYGWNTNTLKDLANYNTHAHTSKIETFTNKDNILWRNPLVEPSSEANLACCLKVSRLFASLQTPASETTPDREAWWPGKWHIARRWN